MTDADLGAVPEDRPGDPGDEPEPASRSDPDETADHTEPKDDQPEPKPAQDHGEEEEYQQTASVINNFYAEVAAHTVGVSGDARQWARPVIRRESGVLSAAEISNSLRYYLRPTPFSCAQEILATKHVVALVGPEGCGKRAGTLELARVTCPKAESYTVLPPTRSLPELASYKSYQAGRAYLLHDWMPVSADSGSAARYDLEQLAARLRKDRAYLAISFEGAGHLQVVLGELSVPWSAPDPTALLERCITTLPDLQLSDAEREQLRSAVAEIHSPRVIIRLAESAVSSFSAALVEIGESENSAVAAWFGSKPARWKVWAVAALTFLSGIGERRFERQLAALTTDDASVSTRLTEASHPDEPRDEDPFPQSRWALANDASLGTFISDRALGAPVGAEHRPAFRSKACRLHFMMELNRRFGDELWTPIRDWLFTLAEQPFGETQIAASYGLALLARCAIQEVEATYLSPWSTGDLQHRLMAVSVLWSMAEDDLVAPAALRIAVSWVRNRGQERAITAALALGGPLGQRYPSEAMRWLWILAQRGERVGRVARTAMSQLFAVEAEAELEKGTVARFLLQKIRPMMKPGVVARERRAALALTNSVLGTTQTLTEVPAAASILRARPADFAPLGELWAAVLNSVPHRREAIWALHRTLTALAEGANSVELAARLGTAILPKLTDRAIEVLEQTLPDPGRAEETSARVIAAFLGVQSQAIGAAR